jgi:D-sedoheptulose 7-phosphate isomerase
MHCKAYLLQTAEIALDINPDEVEALATELFKVKKRIFVCGLGGSMANAIHFAADLRKLCNLDAHAPNVAEFSAWANDEGMAYAFTGWMRDLTNEDAIFILSVGGGTDDVSTGITAAVKFAKERGARVLGIVGPVGGVTAELSDCCIKIPADIARVTPHTEAFQAVIWHCLVSHPLLQRTKAKW